MSSAAWSASVPATTEVPQRVEIGANEDVVAVRQLTRAFGQRAGFSLLEITKLVTAASELARNTLEHGGGGWAVLELLHDGGRSGVRITFEDEGPGIPDVEQALRDGYTSGGGLGLGLGGSRRLVTEFSIETRVGAGTKVVVVRWR
jgi:serine/threonine-protein kinase RsbT